MMRVVLVVISVLAWISLQPKSGIGAQDTDFTAEVFGRELPADAPAEYRQDYLLAPSSISPNKKLALIYPKEGNEFPTQPESGTAENYLVALDPFRIMGPLPVAYFENINYKGLSVNWAKDSSAAVIVSQGKWSPRCVIAFEVRERQIVHQRELSQAVSDFLQADYNKCAGGFHGNCSQRKLETERQKSGRREMRLQQQRQSHSRNKIMASSI